MFNIINEYNLTTTTLFPKPNKEVFVFLFFFTESNQTATEKMRREKKITDGNLVAGTMVLLKAVLESCQAKDHCSTSPHACFSQPNGFCPSL